MLLQGILTFVEGLAGSVLLDITLRSASALLQTVLSIPALAALFRYSARGIHPAWRNMWPAVTMVVLVLDVGCWGFGLYLRFIGSSSFTGAASSAVSPKRHPGERPSKRRADADARRAPAVATAPPIAPPTSEPTTASPG